MISRGHAKHPCTQVLRSHGFAVRPIQRYRCICIRIRGEPLCSADFYSKMGYPDVMVINQKISKKFILID